MRAEWDGAGTPPVGIVCECIYTSPDEYYQAKILALEGELAVFRWIDGPKEGELDEGYQFALQRPSPHPQFRPVRTPKQ